MSEENSKKTNFFKDALKSIKDLDKYEDFALEQPKKAFKYFFMVVLVFVIIITCFYSYKIVNNLGDISANLKKTLPEFTYSNGVLISSLEKPLLIEEYKEVFGKIIIDTKIETNEIDEYIKKLENDSIGILVLKDRVIMLANGARGQVVYKYSDIANSYSITEFTKEDIINYIDNLNIVSIYASVYFMLFVYLFIIYFISILLDVLILSLLAYIVARISRIKMKFPPAFNIAVHGITLSVVLNLIYIIVNLLTGFNIKYFGLMYNTISYIYVIVAILMIKTDFINRQIELMKLAEEQEKVREELEKQKEELKKKREEKEKSKEPKEEKKKDKKEDGEIEGEVNPSVIQEKQ